MERRIYAVGEKHIEMLIPHALEGDSPVQDITAAALAVEQRAEILYKLIVENNVKRIFLEGIDPDRMMGYTSVTGEYDLEQYKDLVRLLDEGFYDNETIEKAHSTIVQFEEGKLGFLGKRKAQKAERILEEMMPQREEYWVEKIDNDFENSSVILCGNGHLIPNSRFNSGRVPELLRQKGYIVEIVRMETKRPKVPVWNPRTASFEYE